MASEVAPRVAPDVHPSVVESEARTRGYIAAATAPNTRRAYRSDWTDFVAWCERYDLTALPATPETVARYLSALAAVAKVSTVGRRLTAIAKAHRTAGHDSPTKSEVVHLTMRGIRRTHGIAPTQKAPTLLVDLRAMVAALPETPLGTRDRALLLLGFAGAFRRAELARIELGHVEDTEHGLRITLPVSKGDRSMKGVQVGIPYGSSELCPVRALRRWLQAASISEGAIFRRIWVTPRPKDPVPDWTPNHVIGQDAIDPGTVARIVKARGKAAGFDADLLGGHSLKRGAMNTAKDRRVHPTQLKQLGRHANYATLGAYLEEGDLFEDNALNGVL